MGLLDDAIREHLELKRRHGADPGDVARQEVEALGEVEHEEPADLLDEDTDDSLGSAEEPALAEAPGSRAPSYERTPEPEVHAEPQAESSTPPHGDPLAAEAHQETREFSAGELHAALGRPEDDAVEPEKGPSADGDGEPEDVLEETPDFLQETPEHDRLWFEQKPPKDFDF